MRDMRHLYNYDGIGCLAHSIKNKFSSLGYTKYIALEPDHELRRIAERSNPLTSVKDEATKSTVMQHGICGIHSPSELNQRHIATPRLGFKVQAQGKHRQHYNVIHGGACVHLSSLIKQLS